MKKNDLHWKKISRKILYKNKRITLVEDDVKLPNGVNTSYLLHGLGKNSVTIICINKDEILLQREYSYPVNKVIYQFPGGKVEKNELIINTAKRELTEESKLEALNFCEIGWYYINNRRSDAKMHVVVAENFKKNNTLKSDLEENIITEWVSISKFELMIKNGQIVNYSVLAAWSLFKAKNN